MDHSIEWSRNDFIIANISAYERIIIIYWKFIAISIIFKAIAYNALDLTLLDSIHIQFNLNCNIITICERLSRCICQWLLQRHVNVHIGEWRMVHRFLYCIDNLGFFGQRNRKRHKALKKGHTEALEQCCILFLFCIYWI